MGQKVNHRRKPIRRSGASFSWDIFSGLSNKEVRPAPYSATYADKLDQAELSQYMHRILTSNLPYYKALARFQDRPLYIPRNGRDARNHRMYMRLTVSGLSILKTQFAKKPKNPV